MAEPVDDCDPAPALRAEILRTAANTHVGECVANGAALGAAVLMIMAFVPAVDNPNSRKIDFEKVSVRTEAIAGLFGAAVGAAAGSGDRSGRKAQVPAEAA